MTDDPLDLAAGLHRRSVSNFFLALSVLALKPCGNRSSLDFSLNLKLSFGRMMRQSRSGAAHIKRRRQFHASNIPDGKTGTVRV
jgi:hypothetical protein